MAGQTRRVRLAAGVAVVLALTATMVQVANRSAAPENVAPRGEYGAVADRLRELITHEMRQKGLPALSIALVDDQEIVWAEGFGVEDPGTDAPATAATVYRVGSVSKLFTDIAVMQLAERGELNIDAPVTNYLPGFRPANPYEVPITLRRLMAHRSGLVREPPVGHYFDPTEPSLAATVASLSDTRLIYEPGTHTKYSNAAIATVGYLLERMQGEAAPPHDARPDSARSATSAAVSFEDYVERAVLRPLGLEHSSFAPRPDLTARLATAWMWTYDGRRFEAPTFQLGMAPAGSMYSTVTDLGHFMSALFAGGRGPGGRVLEPQTLEAMWTPQWERRLPSGASEDGAKSGYGIGFAISELDGHRRIGHGGAIYGFATELAALPDEKLGAVVVTSLDIANSVVGRIANSALRLMLAARDGEPLPELRTTGAVDPALARRLEGRYGRGDAAVDLFERNGRLFLTPRRGGFRMELRAQGDGDGLIVDDRHAYGTRVMPLEGAIVVGEDTLERIAVPRPAPSPARWAGLIGEYGWDHNTLYILEKGGRLHALIEWFFLYPLEEVGRDEFRFPDRGLYDGEGLVFTRDASGRATRVKAAGVIFERRNVGPEGGETFRIDPVRPVEELRPIALAAEPPEETGEFRAPDLVELTSLDPTIRLDVRYATTNNFMGAVFYEEARAFLQRPAAEALVRAHRALAEHGYGLLIHDAYRPWYVTKMFWDATPEHQKLFVADPADGSRHNRGAAVDLTLYDLDTGEPVRMVGGYDEFSPRSYPDYPGGTALQRWHRELLRDAMEAQGFTVYEWEWWHFDYADWADYPILNVTFDRIAAEAAAD